MIAASIATLTLLGPLTAGAATKVGTRTLSWENIRACGVACPQDTYSATGTAGVTSSDKRKAVCAITPLIVPPSNSWGDIIIKVPSSVGGYKPTHANVKIAPTLDWDVYACRVTSDNRYYAYVAGPPATRTGCTADAPGAPVSVGCPETLRFAVTPGQSLVIRAYNKTDPTNALSGTFWYEGVKL